MTGLFTESFSESYYQGTVFTMGVNTTLFITVSNPNDSAPPLNIDLKNIKQWSDDWLVKLNPLKTKCMTISNRNTKHEPLYFGNQKLTEVESHKHLGITFNSKLNWSDHIHNILENVSKTSNVLKRLKCTLDRKTLETIYITFIRPKLEYSSQIWDDCSERDKSLLENVQLEMARTVTGAKKCTSHHLLYDEVSWPTLSERRELRKTELMYKIVHKKTPDYLSEILPEKVGKDNAYLLRNKENFKQFQCRTEKYRKSFFPAAVNTWNTLDTSIRNTEDFELFKKKVIIQKQNNLLFYYGDRKVGIVHAQLRMACSNLKAHLYQLHVIDDPTCSCSNNVEDTYHFFFDCPLYYTNRLELINAITSVSTFTLNVLLYGDSALKLEENQFIFKSVHKYIKNSQRFHV